jgi:hypothetical protein
MDATNTLPVRLRETTPMDLAALDAWDRAHGFEVEPVPDTGVSGTQFHRQTVRPRARRSRTARSKPSASADDGEPPSPFSASRSSPATAEGEEPAPTGEPAGLGDDDPSSDSREPPSHHDTSTRDLAERLRLAADSLPPGRDRARVQRMADRMRDCAARVDGRRPLGLNRCRLPCCPSCQRLVAQRHRRRLDAFLASAPTELLRFVRLSVVADLDRGVVGAIEVLLAALSRLRRRSLWSLSVAAGVQHVEPVAADEDSGCSWNVHAHLVLLLRPGRDLDGDRLAAAWTELLASEPYFACGSSDVRPVRL